MATREAPHRTGTTLEVENPATGEVIATVPKLGAEEVRALVDRARAAQPAWEALGTDGRGEVLLRARRWLGENSERVIETIVSETGKSWDDAEFSEVVYAVQALGFWPRVAPEYLGDEEVETANPFVRGRRLVVRYAPRGVVGVIGPWNYPLTNSFGDCIPALAAGNSVVMKPSEITPLTSLLMAEMLADSGLPQGVFQVATGDGETGAALIDEVDFVHFTGSAETGRRVMERAARTLTPVGLELGGKDPMIVLADADLERAANAAIAYGMGNAGQTCISIERVYVEEPAHEEFVRLVTEKAAALRTGRPEGPGAVDLGAIIFPPQLDLISSHVADAVEKGATVMTGGEPADGPGRFYEPTVLVDVDHSMLCMTQETFGPTLPVMKVGDAEEAVRLANEGRYGLQASVWTRDVGRGEELARRIEAGACCVNDAQVNYTARQSILVTPPYAPPRELHYFPFRPETTLQVAEAVRFSATSELLTDAQRRTLVTLCDTFVPSIEEADDPHGFWARAASHLGVPEAIEQALAEVPAKQLTGLREFLDALEAQGLNEASPEAREAIVHGFADAGPDSLAGIHAVKGLTMTLHYALPDLGTGRNPNWEAIGYPGPPAVPRQVPKELRVRRPETDELTIEADVCVVGSGAGGGVIAGELAGRGKQVCVVEAGGYYNEADFTGLELWAYQSLYLNGGPFPTAEGQVSIQAGSSLGGGTTINWTNSLRTPPWVREQWAREHGLEGLDGPEFDRHLDAVLKRISATDAHSDLNGPQQRLKQGCDALGYDFRLTYRNTDPATYDPEAAGFMGFGDISGSKRSTTKTYLADAQEGGAELVANCRAERVLVEDGRATGVEAAYLGPDGTTARVVVRAAQVVVACGSIESPALLVRSGIGGAAVGDHLRLHPTGAVIGHYEEGQRPWWGPPQGAISHQFADLEDGYGFLIECPHHTTGLAAAAGAWESGRRHKELMLEWARTASFINLTRDRGHGRVTVDATGMAVPEYRLADEVDVRHFRRGLVEMI